MRLITFDKNDKFRGVEYKKGQKIVVTNEIFEEYDKKKIKKAIQPNNNDKKQTN